jgi:hypothetical protein
MYGRFALAVLAPLVDDFTDNLIDLALSEYAALSNGAHHIPLYQYLD